MRLIGWCGHEQDGRERGNPHVPSPGLTFGCPPPFISLLSSKASAKSKSFPTEYHSSVGTSLTTTSQGKAKLCQGTASLEAAKPLTSLLPRVALCRLGNALNLPQGCCCETQKSPCVADRAQEPHKLHQIQVVRAKVARWGRWHGHGCPTAPTPS